MIDRKLYYILCFLLAATIAGCAENTSKNLNNDVPMYAPDAVGTSGELSENIQVDDAVKDVSVERKLTKNGTIRFQTGDIEKSRNSILSLVGQLQGYVASENSSNQNQQTETSLSIRIPAEKFDELMGKIESQALKVDYKNVSVQDVTQRYIDLETRIRTKKEVENRYRELLQKANSMDEVLQIESQIGNIRTEIESAEGQMKYLAGQINYSTLDVTFYKKNTGFGFARKMKSALESGWSNLLWVIVGLTNLWAIVLFVAVAWIIIARISKRKKRIKRDMT